MHMHIRLSVPTELAGLEQAADAGIKNYTRQFTNGLQLQTSPCSRKERSEPRVSPTLSARTSSEAACFCSGGGTESGP